MSNINAIGLGALNIDNIYQVEHILEDGEATVKGATSFPGGSAANTVFGLAKLGIGCGFVGAVGDDAAGKILLQDFQKASVDTSQIRTKIGARSGSVVCLSDGLGRRSLYVSPGANDLLSMDDLDTGYINQAKLLHITSFAGDRQLKLLVKLMDKLGLFVKVSFSPGNLFAARGLKALTPILSRTYVLFANQDEIQHLTGKDITAGTETFLEKGCKIVVVTLGKGRKLELSKGMSTRTATAVAYIRNLDKEYVVEPATQHTTRTPRTTGAGDAFATGFLYGLLKEKELDICGRLGDLVAQFAISRVGAREGLPGLGELSQRYQQLYNVQL